MREMKQFSPRFWWGSGLILYIFLSACTPLLNSPPPVPWQEAYQPLNDPAAEAFIHSGLAQAEAEFGPSAFPVKKVLLRRSKKRASVQNYALAENFSLTEAVEKKKGVFAIYIGVDPSDPEYYPMLGHECAHLLNPFIFDWYMEGFATVFSEEICNKTGHDWSVWKKRFKKNRHEPYACSYRMMRDLKRAFPSAYSSFLHYAKPNPKIPGRDYIDINAWLDSLPPNRRAEAVNIIEPNVKLLRHRSGAQYHFEVPR